MTKRSILLLAAVAILVGLSQFASAYPVRHVDLVRDAWKSDVVLVGELQGLPSHGPADEKGEADISWPFHVDRVLKGSLASGSTINVKYRFRASAATMSPNLSPPGAVIALLEKVGDSYEFAFPNASTISTSKIARTPYTQSSDVRKNLRWEIINSLLDEKGLVLGKALRQAPHVLSPEDITRYVKPLTESDSAGIRAGAVKACLSIGDQSVVTPTLQYIEERLEKEGNARSSQNGISILALSLREAKVTKDNLPMFAEALNSKCGRLREDVALMLEHCGLREAIPYLKAALDNENRLVRYRAMMGLADMAKDYPHAPAYAVFAGKEADYIDYWKAKVTEE